MERFLWYAFVFFLPFSTVWILREVFVEGEKWQYASFGIYAAEVVLLALAVFSVASNRWKGVFRRGVSIIRSPFPVLFLLFVLWAFLSVLWADDPLIALQTSLVFFLGFLTFLFARSGKFSTRKTMMVFVAALAVHAAIGIGQFAMQYSPEVTFLGMPERVPQEPGVSVLKNDSGRWLRAYGGMAHPNVFAGAVSVAMVFALILFVTEKRRVYRSVFLIAGALFAFALVLSFSRAAWLGMVLVLGFLVFLSWQKPREWRKRPFLFFGVVFLASAVCALLVQENVFPRFSQETIAVEGSISDRSTYLEQARRMIAEHTLLGVGAGNFTVETSRAHWKENSYIALFQPAHNAPLLLWAELGLIGLLLAGMLFVALVRRGISSRQLFLLAALFAILPAALLDHWLVASHFGILLVSLLAGMVSRKDV